MFRYYQSYDKLKPRDGCKKLPAFVIITQIDTTLYVSCHLCITQIDTTLYVGWHLCITQIDTTLYVGFHLCITQIDTTLYVGWHLSSNTENYLYSDFTKRADSNTENYQSEWHQIHYNVTSVLKILTYIILDIASLRY